MISVAVWDQASLEGMAPKRNPVSGAVRQPSTPAAATPTQHHVPARGRAPVVPRNDAVRARSRLVPSLPVAPAPQQAPSWRPWSGRPHRLYGEEVDQLRVPGGPSYRLTIPPWRSCESLVEERPAGVYDTGAFDCLIPPNGNDVMTIDASPKPPSTRSEQRKYNKAMGAVIDALEIQQKLTKEWLDNLPYHKFCEEIRDACEVFLLDVTSSISKLEILRNADRGNARAINDNIEEGDRSMTVLTIDFDKIGANIYQYLPDDYVTQWGPKKERQRALKRQRTGSDLPNPSTSSSSSGPAPVPVDEAI